MDILQHIFVNRSKNYTEIENKQEPKKQKKNVQITHGCVIGGVGLGVNVHMPVKALVKVVYLMCKVLSCKLQSMLVISIWGPDKKVRVISSTR